MPQLLPSIQWKLKRLVSAHTSLEILARPTASAIPPSLPSVSTQWVSSQDDPHFPQLVQIQSEQGLDESWCREQLTNGSSAVIAVVDGTPAGVGMYTRGEFWVGEIDHLYHPGPTACYLYATYVSPRFRGRRVQRLLDLSRVHRGAQDGVDHAIAIVVSTNIASLRGHAAGGFRPVGRIDHFRLAGRSIMLVRKKTSKAPVGNFPGGGFLKSNCLHFIRT
jgi:hypothetical protein